MTSVLDSLLEVLDLERIEDLIFRGQSQDLGWHRVFGGQVVAQALVAAERTAPDDRQVHSLHGYFLRHGAADRPVVYVVDPIRDGGSFTTRRVVAWQEGQAIFNLACSFQVREEGYGHQDAMPSAPAPEDLPSEQELSRRYMERLPEPVRQAIPAVLREQALAASPIDKRWVDPIDPVRPGERPPRRQVWFRANGPLPDDAALHRRLLAYVSDFHFLVTAMQPHGVSWLTPGLQVASLDHAMWFHADVRLDDWVLYDIESPAAGGSRGLVRGRLFQRDGTLVASVVQEGLMRDRRLRLVRPGDSA